MIDNKFLSKLSQNLLEILDDNEYYDITIEVGNDPYVRIFRAHKVILNYRSPHLQSILSTNKKNDDETLSHIKLPNISPESFQIILRYIYSGSLSLEEHDTSSIIKILVTANELSLQELVSYLQTFLIENSANWVEQDFNLIYQTSFESDSFLELQKFCTGLMLKEPDKIFNSPNFTSISEKLLVSLIQHDSPQISEIQVWEYVLKWGLAQNPGLPSDPTSFSKSDFDILKNTLQQFIPFIRFYNLTPKEFSDLVSPYGEILPGELYIDLLKTLLNLHPDSEPSDESKPRLNRETSLKLIDSKIITFQHAELISKWIDRLDFTDKLTSAYDFKLMLRGSRDGLTPSKFHEICDNQSHTVSIIKVKDSDEILGGYNPVAWDSNDHYTTTKDSFIFSFKNDGIENHILSRVIDEKYAISNWEFCGPSFGYGDLKLCGNNFYSNSYCLQFSYEEPIRETKNSIYTEEYEFNVIPVGENGFNEFSFEENEFNEFPIEENVLRDFSVEVSEINEIPVEVSEINEIPVEENDGIYVEFNEIHIGENEFSEFPVEENGISEISVELNEFNEIPVGENGISEFPVEENGISEISVELNEFSEIPVEENEIPIDENGFLMDENGFSEFPVEENEFNFNEIPVEENDEFLVEENEFNEFTMKENVFNEFSVEEYEIFQITKD